MDCEDVEPCGCRPLNLVDVCVLGLVVMATWTLVIKYVAPLTWAYAENQAGHSVAAPIMWDFWWVAHIWLARMFWNRHRWAWMSGLLVTVAEIVIVVVKFVGFFRDPDPEFWRLLWFTNKVYVLAYFLVLLVLLFLPAFQRQLRPLDQRLRLDP